MRSDFLVILLGAALWASEPPLVGANETVSPLPVAFTIVGGVDHYNSWGTHGVFGAGVAVSLPHTITISTDLVAQRSLSWRLAGAFQPWQWFTVDGGYALNRYSHYSTDEHNLFLGSHYRYKQRPVGVRGTLGWNFRWVVFDAEAPYFTSFPHWEVVLLTTPVEKWELNLALRNSHLNLPVSSGYLEIALENSVALGQHLILEVTAGIAPSGFFSIAGYIDRFFFLTGISYEL